MRRNLKPGRLIDLSVTARVGVTGTVADIAIDWTASVKSNRSMDDTTTTEVGVTDGLGETRNGRLMYAVNLDESTGQLWIDDECGY